MGAVGEFPGPATRSHCGSRNWSGSRTSASRMSACRRPKTPAQLNEVIRIIRRLNMEADLEGPVPESLQPLTHSARGPADRAVGRATRVSALAARRPARAAGTARFRQTGDHLDRCGRYARSTAGFHAGAMNFAGEETAAALPIRRNAQLFDIWGATLVSPHRRSAAPLRNRNTAVRSNDGTSFVSAVNNLCEAAERRSEGSLSRRSSASCCCRT